MDRRCRTCKHWSGGAGHFGDCSAIQHGHPIINHDPESVLDENIAYTSDASDYASALTTGGDFSCSLWEGKDGER